MLQEQPSSNPIQISDEDDSDDDDIRYTSLRDVISRSSVSFLHQRNSSLEGLFPPEMMDYSNIAIRNELVKRAASVYLNSSMVVVVPDLNWFQRLSLKAKHLVFVAVACLRPAYRLFARIVIDVSRRMIRFS
ncbi:PREDICTED: uncharacterized protein LOC104812865 [Tarenaya hassleriana]|uniref:uncharacterized protein LOC104812865 n=1 Tax=Tarenaya hassleriana TaxID=28532 RepID=UPI00053C40DA|nr:PREDICTED: uncharacterized protein LOC104812865 [Tarenaya hassleriana]